jgi:hypothetical protein
MGLTTRSFFSADKETWLAVSLLAAGLIVTLHGAVFVVDEDAFLG